MVATVIAAAGAFIGNAIAPGALGFLGLTGASAGWLAGSLLASAFAPTQRSVGPRLDDLKVSGSAYGAVLPYIEGRPRLAGQIAWASDKREIESTQRSGKGGGGSSVTTFTYEVDVFILLTSVPCVALLKVFSGGDLVFNQTVGATAGTFSASNSAPQWGRITFYGGGPSQQPDPDMEAVLGVDNTPAYRGRAGVFIKSLKLGQSGQLPNLTFEVARTAEPGYAQTFFREEVGDSTTLQPNLFGDPYTDLLPFMDFTQRKFGQSALAAGQVVADHVGEDSTYAAATLARMLRQGQHTGDVTYEMWVYVNAYPAYSPPTNTTFPLFRLRPFAWNDGGNPLWPGEERRDAQYGAHHALMMDHEGHVYPRFCYGQFSGVWSWGPLVSATTTFSGDPTVHPRAIPLNTWAHVVMYREANIWYTIVDGVEFAHTWFDPDGDAGLHHASEAAPPYHYHMTQAWIDYCEGLETADSEYAELQIGNAQNVIIDGFRMSDSAIYAAQYFEFGDSSDITVRGGYVTPSAAPSAQTGSLVVYNFDEFDAYLATYPSIAAVVDRLCTDCAGMPDEWVDVSDIESISTPVYALTVSQVSAPRVTIEMLMGCYFFEAFARGNALHFRKRAGAAVATIAYEDLGWHAQGQSTPEAFGRVAGDSLPLPVQIALVFSDVNSDHQTDTQYSSRVEGAQGSIAVFQVPLGLTPSIAKIIADARLADMYAALRTAHIGLSLAYSRYEPTDVFIVASHDGSQFRMRSLKRVDADSVIEHDLVLDDATIFTQLGLTVGGTGAQTIVLPVPFTMMELLDIPLLRDADDSPGLYVAVKGSNDQWRTADLFDSPDAVNYTYLQTVNAEAVFGTCTSVLGDWTGGTVMDEMSHVTVNVDRGTLSSVTYADMLLNVAVNMAVIGDELVQYRDATLVATGIYKLTGLLRGRRGTEWAMLDHGVNERFVALGTTGMRFLPLQVSDLDRERYYKAASAGQQLSASTAQPITPAAINLEPFSPVGLAANRDDPAMTLLTWIRRTRLSTRVGGPSPPVIPLGEASEEYLLEIFDGTTIVRTETVTTAEFEYTDTMQIADFGSMQDPITFRVRQVSAIAGPGYPAEATV
jgi:hypothetical protein